MQKYQKEYFMNIDNSLAGQNLYYIVNRSSYTSGYGLGTVIKFYLEDGTIEKWEETGNTATTTGKKSSTHIIPEGCYKISYYEYKIGTYTAKLFEIGLGNPFEITYEQCYPKLTENGVIHTRCEIKLNYFDSSKKKLYKINDGEWKEYENQIINLFNEGDIIYSKGIDKDGVETNVESYTASLLKNGLPATTYDNDETTYLKSYKTYYYMDVDESAIGKTLYYRKYNSHTASFAATKITFYINDGTTEVWSNTEKATYEQKYTYTIPEGCYRISYYQGQQGTQAAYLYEIGVE